MFSTFSRVVKAIVTMSLAQAVGAHIIMTNPAPYGVSSLNNSPLDVTGADYPCKQRPGVYEMTGDANIYPAGSKQQLSFKGSSVHGGGSCQVSLTTDAPPSLNSTWKVIKSIQGGCPAKGQVGNMDSNPDAVVPYHYDYTIPAGLPAGEYTLAWTWYNKMGNREMYMNCAPLRIVGDGDEASTLEGLPDMFVANIGNGCGTVGGRDTLFPNPGDDVDFFNGAGATEAFSTPTGQCGPIATGLASAGRDQPTLTLGETSPVVAPPTPEVAAGTGDSAKTDPGRMPSFATGMECSPNGLWNCIGGSSFQRCASGVWSPVQRLPAGAICAPGQSTELGSVTY